MNAVARDRAFGRFFARRGAARALAEAWNAPNERDRLIRYYAARAAHSDFDPLALASRARRGLLIQRRLARRKGRAEARSVDCVSSLEAVRHRSSRAPGSGQGALIPPRWQHDGLHEAELPDWHPDSLRYAGP